MIGIARVTLRELNLKVGIDLVTNGLRERQNVDVVCRSNVHHGAVRAVESVLEQAYEPMEVVVVIDGNREVFECTENRFGDRDRVHIYCNDENRGISYSRTRGAELATGEVVAFIDDDSVAEPDWIAEHVRVYEETDAITTAGPVEPEWLSGEPDFFPPEFYWLVGCTERGFAEDGEVIRNGYGSNVTYRREPFLAVGGYDENTGRKGEANIQAHEPPVSVRLRQRFDQGVHYTADAVVHHQLAPYRGRFGWLLERSFSQGYSKRIMDLVLPKAKRDERDYFRDLTVQYLPERVWRAIAGRSSSAAKQAGAIVAFTAAVGFGYLYGHLKPRETLLRADG